MYLAVIGTIVFIFLVLFLIKKEKFAGALTQLYAKGPEDVYLTSGIQKYIPPYFGDYGFLWNQPTRLAYPYYYPTYGIFPYTYSYPIFKY